MNPSPISFQLIRHNSREYEEEIALRDEVLRKPLGLAYTQDQLEQEKDSYHLACRLGKALVACVILKPISDDLMQMRQFAVRSEYQGQGYGRQLAKYAEDFARQKGVKEIYLHSREIALSFYEKLGYRKEGEPFTEVTLPHRRMRKNLKSTAT
jgi:N-acetylglutamate synthase-like GNAT family acetyltransferase